jgi:gliding motility-associated-like protein
MRALLFYLSFAYLLLISCIASAQKENNNWVFGFYCGLTFNTTPPSSFNSKILHDYNAAAASDASGNLLFYTNGLDVWDRNNNVMPNGRNLIQNYGRLPLNDACAEATIIPLPGNNNKYYIFSSPAGHEPPAGQTDPYELKYSIVDMTLNNGLGDVVSGNKGTVVDNNVLAAICVAGNGNCDKWLIMHKTNSGDFAAYPLTSSGIGSAVISTVGNRIYDRPFTKVRVSDDDRKLVFRTFDDDSLAGFLQIFDFNVLTGKITNPVLIDTFNGRNNSNVYAIAFSPNCKRLFYSEFDSSFNGDININQVALDLPTPVTVRNSKQLVGVQHALGDIQSGPDNKLYFIDSHFSGAAKIGVIHYPDIYGTGCKVENAAIAIPYNQAVPSYGFFNKLPANHVVSSHDSVQACNLPYQLTAPLPGANYIWNTGNISQSINITQAGVYWVKSEQSCGATRIDTFKVFYKPYSQLQNIVSCDNKPITVKMDPLGYYNWSDGSSGNTFTTNISGNFTVTSIIGQCYYQDTFNVLIYPPQSTPLLPGDTLICNEQLSANIVPYYQFDNYKWNTGSTSPQIEVKRPGVYYFSANTACGIFTDSVLVNFCAPVIDSIYLSSDSICKSNCISVSAATSNYPKTFKWSFPGGNPETFQGAEPGSICYNEPGQYLISLTVTSIGGAAQYSTMLAVLPVPEGRFTDTTVTISYKQLLQLPACGEASKINWYINDSLLCENCNDITLKATLYKSTYKCILSNSDCKDECTYQVTVTDIPTELALPNAFTPNGDGKNDFFRIVTDNPNIRIRNFSVFNRFGQRVYRSAGDKRGWDGTYLGMPADLGAYFWQISYTVDGDRADASYYQKGDVLLLK